MRWVGIDNGWRKRFAWLPMTLRNGPEKTTIWLEPYWAMSGGYCTLVSLENPNDEK